MKKTRKKVIIETTPKDVVNIIRMAKIELLDDFKKANPYYYGKIMECNDFQKIIKKLRHLSTFQKEKRHNSSFIQDCLNPTTKCDFRCATGCTNKNEYQECLGGSPK